MDKGKHMKRILIILFFALIFCSVFFAGKSIGEKGSHNMGPHNMGPQKDAQQKNMDPDSFDKADKKGDSHKQDKQQNQEEVKGIIPVKVMDVQYKDLKKTASLSGLVEAVKKVTVRAGSTGIIEQMNVIEGQDVKKGQILALVESSAQQLAIEKAELAVKQAENKLARLNAPKREEEIKLQELKIAQARIRLKQSKELLDTNRELFKENLLIEGKLEESQTNFDLAEQELLIFKLPPGEHELIEAQLNLDQNKIALKNSVAELEKRKIKAPMDGRITALFKEVYELTGLDQEFCRITDLSAFKVTASAPFNTAKGFFPGQKCIIDIESGAGVTGEVKYIASEVSADSGTLKVEMIFKENIHNLKPGMFASVLIEIDSRKNVPAVPRNAVIRKDNKEYLYIVETPPAKDIGADFSTPKIREIKSGYYDKEWIQVEKGLGNGDRIIVLGHNLIDETSRIKIIE
jgi:multidrug efflux pump subunit AcrA (membrane-fusion protein)